MLVEQIGTARYSVHLGSTEFSAGRPSQGEDKVNDVQHLGAVEIIIQQSSKSACSDGFQELNAILVADGVHANMGLEILAVVIRHGAGRISAALIEPTILQGSVKEQMITLLACAFQKRNWRRGCHRGIGQRWCKLGRNVEIWGPVDMHEKTINVCRCIIFKVQDARLRLLRHVLASGLHVKLHLSWLVAW